MSSERPAVRHLTTRQLAERWGKTTHAIHMMRWKGDAPAAIKIGDRLLFPLDVIERYEHQRRTLSTAEAVR